MEFVLEAWLVYCFSSMEHHGSKLVFHVFVLKIKMIAAGPSFNTQPPTTAKHYPLTNLNYTVSEFFTPVAHKPTALLILVYPIRNKSLFHLGWPLDTIECFLAISATCQMPNAVLSY